jgi:hypothetical protein
MPDLITAAEAASLLGLHVSGFFKRINLNKMPKCVARGEKGGGLWDKDEVLRCDKLTLKTWSRRRNFMITPIISEVIVHEYTNNHLSPGKISVLLSEKHQFFMCQATIIKFLKKKGVYIALPGRSTKNISA